MKIVELTIDEFDDLSGLDGIALVNRPAHQENFYYFSKEQLYVIPKEKQEELLELLNVVGEDYEDMEKDGYTLVRVEDISEEDFIYDNPCQTGYVAYGTKMKNGKEVPNCVPREDFFEQSDIKSDPNAISAYDNLFQRVRYKYVGPRDNKNRDFCAGMMKANKVFRYEDIVAMSENNANDEFGSYDIFKWRGSYNCRHKWVKLIYQSIEESGRIANKAQRKKGLQEEVDIPNEPTITEKTANARGRQKLSAIDIIDGQPLFDNIEEAEDMAEIMGCEGHHEHMIDGEVYYMPCRTHKFNSTSQYPQSMRDEARRGVELNMENDNKCATLVGKNRGKDIMEGRPLTDTTIKRMYSYLSRAYPEYQKAKASKDYNSCSYTSFKLWGGESALRWSEGMVKKIEEGKFDFNQEKGEIVGAAMIPNKLIKRINEITGEEYYVFFTEETIKQISDKYFKNKLTDATNIEHRDKFIDGVYITESWIVDNPETDKQTSYGLNHPKGSWIIKMKVDNDGVKKNIKKGLLNGFSVQGLFEEKYLFNDIYDNMLRKINYIIKNIND